MMYNLTPFARNPFRVFDIFDDLERDLTSGNMAVNTCRTDVRDMGDKYIMESELAGFDKEDIKIDIKGDYITISAEHKSEKSDEENGRYIRRERSYGSFKRSFGISDVNADEISAEYKNGILTLELPKKKPQEPVSKSLEIK